MNIARALTVGRHMLIWDVTLEQQLWNSSEFREDFHKLVQQTNVAIHDK